MFLQVQKRSGAWFFKGRVQQGLPAPLPLSRPRQSSTEDSSGQAGQDRPQEPIAPHQGYGNYHGNTLYEGPCYKH